MPVMLIALIVIIVLLAYAWVGYPWIVLALGRRRTHPFPLQGGDSPCWFPSLEGEGVGSSPPVSILFSAHNEASVIRQRLENLAALDYPADHLRVFVGVDGGEDRTAEIALAWAQAHPNVRVVVSQQNCGKTAMLKRLVETCGKREAGSGQGEDNADSASVSRLPLAAYRLPLLVFTDANTMFAHDALKRLVALFADPRIGGVCGRLVLVGTPLSSGTDESIYWNLETRLKMSESALGSCLGANGAIYAIRAPLFPGRTERHGAGPGAKAGSEFPENTIIDDFVIGMKVREAGYRMVYEPGAIATEELPATVEDEWRRRVRIGTGAYQALSLCRRCLLPRYGAFAWMFWSHKVLRWFTPHLLLVMAACSVAAVLGERGPGAPWLGFLPHLSILGVTGLLAAALMGERVHAFRPLRYFVVMQAALFVGFVRFCRGEVSGKWRRTARAEPTPAPPRRGTDREYW